MWGKFSKCAQPGGRIVRNYRTRRPNDKFETTGARFEIGYTDVKWADQFFVGYNFKDFPNVKNSKRDGPWRKSFPLTGMEA